MALGREWRERRAAVAACLGLGAEWQGFRRPSQAKGSSLVLSFHLLHSAASSTGRSMVTTQKHAGVLGQKGQGGRGSCRCLLTGPPLPQGPGLTSPAPRLSGGSLYTNPGPWFLSVPQKTPPEPGPPGAYRLAWESAPSDK